MHEYGPDGVLVAIDGRRLQPPPAQFDLPDGSVLERRTCVRIAEELDFEAERTGPIGCLELFEEYQKCGDDACRGQVVADAARRKDELDHSNTDSADQKWPRGRISDPGRGLGTHQTPTVP